MIIGYARTSTMDQVAGLEAQLRDLKAAGVEKIFEEQVSSVASRAQLDAALDFVRNGDVFVVTKIDRLARSVIGLCAIIQSLEAKGVALRILAMNLDTGTPTGKLMLNVLASVAQFEREIMLERQQEGIMKAKADGVRLGKAPVKWTANQAAEARRMKEEGCSAKDIAAHFGIGRSTFYRLPH